MNPILLLPILFVLFFSVIIHEVSHGYAALRNGDDTARIMGRLTLSPLPHIDPFGTVILPLILVFIGSPFLFGWAKPVPINPHRFHDYRKGMLEVGASGPLSNIMLALIFSLLFRVISPGASTGVGLLLLYGVFINYLLALFNLIPVPPLDGSRIVGSLLSFESQNSYFRLERYGIFIVFGLLFLTPLFEYLLAFINALVALTAGVPLR